MRCGELAVCAVCAVAVYAEYAEFDGGKDVYGNRKAIIIVILAIASY